MEVSSPCNNVMKNGISAVVVETAEEMRATMQWRRILQLKFQSSQCWSQSRDHDIDFSRITRNSPPKLEA